MVQIGKVNGIRGEKRLEKGEAMTKFVQSLDPKIFEQLKAIAMERGVTVQALIRQIVAEWLIKQKKS